MNWKTFARSDYATVTAAQMAKLDQLAMTEGYLLFQMMENAGRSLTMLAQALFAANNVAVLAGPGGNGGGGLVAARHLVNSGVGVRIFPSRNISDFHSIPRFQASLAAKSGAEFGEPGDFHPDSFDLVIDALTGYSLEGSLRGNAANLVYSLGESPNPILSLDIPSGSNPDSGLGSPVVSPAATMTVAAVKQGLLTAKTGRLFLADIGIPRPFYSSLGLTDAAPRTMLGELI